MIALGIRKLGSKQAPETNGHTHAHWFSQQVYWVHCVIAKSRPQQESICIRKIYGSSGKRRKDENPGGICWLNSVILVERPILYIYILNVQTAKDYKVIRPLEIDYTR